MTVILSSGNSVVEYTVRVYFLENVMARSRTKQGKFSAKRSDTQVGTIEKQYGVNFGVRSNMKLSTYLKRQGLPSMSKALQQVESRLSE